MLVGFKIDDKMRSAKRIEYNIILTKASRHSTEWKPEDYKFLRDNYLEMTDAEIANILKRSEIAIQGKRVLLKLSRVVRKTEYIRKRKLQMLRGAIKRNYRLTWQLKRMQVLIFICENQPNKYKRDLAKAELVKLSGL